MKEFLSKNGQKELRQKYEIALSDAWKNRNGKIDTRMVNFCLKDISVIIPMSNGTIVAIDKPRIDKDFCFGYSNCGQGMSYDECQRTHQAVSDNLAEYFKEENLRGFDSRYREFVNGASEENFHKGVHLSGKYWSQSKTNPLRNITTDAVREMEPVTAEPVTAEDIENYVEAVKFVRSEFEKKLDSYLKRYGTSKLRTWTYWVDE